MRFLALSLALICSGCSSASSGQGPGSVSGSDSEDAAQAPVVSIGERRLSKAQLADYWFHRYPQEYTRTLDELVDEWVVWGEARRLSLAVSPALVQAAVEEEARAREEQLRTRYGPTAELAVEVHATYGLTVAQWKANILTPRLASRLLMERVIRHDSRRRERLHARAIVLLQEARARSVRARLDQGADFALLARSESEDPSATRGGDLPWFSRGDLAVAGVEDPLFAAKVGELVGPLAVNVQGVPQWHIYRVVDRTEAWPQLMPDLEARIEEDLRARPVDQGEFERWRVRLRKERAVTYYRPDGQPWVPAGPASAR